MSRTAYFWSPASLGHDTGHHVEAIARAERLRPEAVAERVGGLDVRPPAPHGAADWVLRVHEPAHHDFVREAFGRGFRVLDKGDTRISEGSYAAALGAVDAALSAADAVMAGEADNAFCAVRPPGHHALPFASMGFCLFATGAIAVRYLQECHGVKRVAVVDWDVHHGNGTQHIFWTDPDVLFVSLHEFPLFPGSGRADERGEGPGLGATLNIPLPAGTGEDAYLERFEADVLPALRAHRPEALVISAGFDAHRGDPLGGMRLGEESFGRLTRLLKDLAAEVCGGRIVSLLEGGYNLDALLSSVVAHLEALRGEGLEIGSYFSSN